MHLWCQSGATVGLSRPPLGADELGKQEEVASCLPREIFPLHLASVGAMSHHFHSHQDSHRGEGNPPACRLLFRHTQEVENAGANACVALWCPRALRMCVYRQTNCFKRVRMQLFHFPSHSELLMFRNKSLPVLLIYNKT